MNKQESTFKPMSGNIGLLLILILGIGGIRVWTKYGTVYNAQGKIGLSIKLKSGKQFVIGTQKKVK